MTKRDLQAVEYAAERAEPRDEAQGVEPVAWAVDSPIGSIMPLCHSKQQAEEVAAKLTSPSTVVPLYRAPQPLLTAEEREAIEASREFWQVEADCALGDETDRRYADTLGGLLARAGDTK